MNFYQIADLERITGIKAHTIRIWEKRYSLIEPDRTSTNRRRYDEHQVKKLLNVSALLAGGQKISKIAQLKDRQLGEKILEQQLQSSSDVVAQGFINDLTLAMLNFNEAAFEKSFSAAIIRFGLYEAMLQIVYPLLHKIGLLWAASQVMPVQEHFASAIIKRKLLTAIDGLPMPTRKKKFLLFLPPNEYHEIGLLFSNYLIRSRGFETIYLGQSVPYENVAAVLKQVKPAYSLTFYIGNRSAPDVAEQLLENKVLYKQVPLLVSGNAEVLAGLKKQKHLTILSNPQQLLPLLA